MMVKKIKIVNIHKETLVFMGALRFVLKNFNEVNLHTVGKYSFDSGSESSVSLSVSFPVLLL